jgi:hypothetical protein
MAERDRIVTAADLEKMTPQQRADVIDASVVTDWDDVPESFRATVDAAARRLGEQRRARA